MCDCVRDHRQCIINVPALTFCNSLVEFDSNLHSKFSNQSTRSLVPLPWNHQPECSILGGSACRHLFFSHDQKHIVWWIIRHTMNAHTDVHAFMLSEMFRSRIHQSQSETYPFCRQGGKAGPAELSGVTACWRCSDIGAMHLFDTPMHVRDFLLWVELV